MQDQAPPGGTPPRSSATVSIPGICRLGINALADEHEWITTTTRGQYHDGDLIFGDNRACGPMRIHYDTAAEYRALARKADRLADWLEAS